MHTSGTERSAEVVPLLLSAGANHALRDQHGRTPIIVHAQEGHAAAVFALLEAGADPNIVDSDGQTALFSAALHGHEEVVTMLVERRCAVDVANTHGVDALMGAAYQGHTRIALRLLAAGASEGQRSEQGFSALGLAIESDHPDVARVLIEAGVPLDQPASPRGTALHAAAGHGDAATITQLLAHHAAINAVSEGLSPIGYAIVERHDAVVRQLLDAGADVHVSVQGATLLHIAALTGSRTTELLLERGINVNALNLQGGTALRAASEAGALEVVDYLLAHGADPLLRDSFGLLATDYAAQSGHADVVRRLAQSR